jgi:hypothetical protein
MRDDEPSDFTRLLEDYCRTCGMGDVEIGPAAGKFVVEDVTVIVEHDKEFARLSMKTTVADAPPERREELVPILLQFNLPLGLSGGQAFCMDMETGQIALQQSLLLKSLDADEIDRQLGMMVARCRAARNLIATLIDGPTIALDAGTQSEWTEIRFAI